MKVVVDGIFFQHAVTGIARIWSSLLPRMAGFSGLELVVLDRGGLPEFDGIETVDFPSYKMNTGTAADSLLLDRFCRELGADVFVSTYYTSPVTVPSALLVYDMIPEVLGFDLTQRPWLEKQVAISFASRYACISERTRRDLELHYPGAGKRAIVAYCGVDREIFRPQSSAAVEGFRRKLDLRRPYFLLVGSREQHLGYKNGALVFQAAQGMRDEFEILCVGGEPQIAESWLAGLPANVSARHARLTDGELACAYGGAEALIFPSRYEGFGMPVAEAMACGCPVVTTRNGSLDEVGGDAALFVSGEDAGELRQAISAIRSGDVRGPLVEKGIERASRFSWDAMARQLHELLRAACEDGGRADRRQFVEEWKRLRTLQAAVDPCRIADL